MQSPILTVSFTQNSANLSWTDPSNGLASFFIEKAQSSSGPFTKIVNDTNGQLSFTDTNLSPNTSYFYRVTAFIGNSVSSVIGGKTLDVMPNAPTNLVATVISSSQINLNWNDNSNNESGFKIQKLVGTNWTEIASLGPQIVSYSDSNLNPSTNYSYRVYAFNNAGNSVFSNVVSATTNPVVVASNVIGYWKLENLVKDEMGNFVNGSLSGGASWVNGINGKGLLFNNGYALIPNSSIFTSVTNKFSFSFWVNKQSNSSDYGVLMGRRFGTGSQDWLDIGYWNDTNKSYYFGLRTINGPVYINIGNSTLDINKWVHLAGTYDGATIKLYKNGQQIISAPLSGNVPTETTSLIFGAGDNGTNGIKEFSNVIMDEIQLWNKALTPTEINDLYSLYAPVIIPDPPTNGTFTIPSGHPRLWFTPARLAQAKAWWVNNSFIPSSLSNGAYAAQQNAFAYLMTGNTNYARTAINWLLSYNLSDVNSGTGSISDYARWHGEYAILVFDWCYDQMTSSEKQQIMVKWNNYISTLNSASWGNLGFSANNYYWGYLRNSLEWGITTYGENPAAQGFIDNALTTRWANDFIPFAAAKGKGGVFWEGTNYGSYVYWYPIIPFDSVKNMGRNIWEESNVYKEVLACLLYSVTPSPTYQPWSNNSEYSLFYFSDIAMGNGEYRNLYRTSEVGDIMSQYARNWSNTNLGKYARFWLNKINPNISYVFKSIDQNGPALDYSSLPLDYYADGNKYLYAKNKWGNDATSIFIQMGIAAACSHRHLDMGAFQIWRNGRWLSRSTAGYSDTIPNYASSGTKDVLNTVAHNCLLLGGQGIPNEFYGRVSIATQGNVTRLESKPNYTYASVDLSSIYTYNNSTTYGNPNAKTVVREYIFLKDLETLVVFDRIETTTATANKTFLLHSEVNPTIENSNHVRMVNGSETLRLTTLLPCNISYRVVNEQNTFPKYGQYRLEIDTNGSTQQYFLNVLQSKSNNTPDLSPTIIDNGTSYTVQIGATSIVLNKGMTSTGGSINGNPLAMTVQKCTVTDAGVTWS